MIDIDRKPDTEHELAQLDNAARSLVLGSRIYRAITHQWRNRHGNVLTRPDEDWLVQSKIKDEIAALTDLIQTRPEVFHELLLHGIDCLHGTTTLNLKGILDHGIVPAHTLQDMGILALGKENYTQPYARQGVHVVPIAYVDETGRYAEKKLGENVKDYVNPRNYEDFLGFQDIESSTMYPSLKAYFTGHAEEARAIRDMVDRQEITKDSVGPVVIGVDSSTMSDDAEFIHADSAVKGDVITNGRIRTQHIKVIYVSEDQLGLTRQMVTERGLMHIAVQDIANIRGAKQASASAA